MQLKSFVLIFILAFSHYAYAQKNTQSKKIKRSPSQVMDELSDFAGYYDLESGQTRYCPDGFFQIGENFLIIGANIRVTDINKGVVVKPKGPQSACTVRREATLNGKKLQWNRSETCDNTTSNSHYELELSEDQGRKKIHLSAKRNTQSIDLKKSTLEFQCIYVRNLKLM